jgi:hypothetical protein
MERTNSNHDTKPFKASRQHSQQTRQQGRSYSPRASNTTPSQWPVPQPQAFGSPYIHPYAPITFMATPQSNNPYQWIETFVPMAHPNPRDGQYDYYWHHAYVNPLDGSKWISQEPAPMIPLVGYSSSVPEGSSSHLQIQEKKEVNQNHPVVPQVKDVIQKQTVQHSSAKNSSLVEYLAKKPELRGVADLSALRDSEQAMIWKRVKEKQQPLLQTLQSALALKKSPAQSMRMIKEYLAQMESMSLPDKVFDELGELACQKIQSWSQQVMQNLQQHPNSSANDLLNMLKIDTLCRPWPPQHFIDSLRKCFKKSMKDKDFAAKDLLPLIDEAFFVKELPDVLQMYRWMTVLLQSSNKVLQHSTPILVLKRKVYEMPPFTLQKISLFCQAIESDPAKRLELLAESLVESQQWVRVTECLVHTPAEYQPQLKKLIAAVSKQEIDDDIVYKNLFLQQHIYCLFTTPAEQMEILRSLLSLYKKDEISSQEIVKQMDEIATKLPEDASQDRGKQLGQQVKDLQL